MLQVRLKPLILRIVVADHLGLELLIVFHFTPINVVVARTTTRERELVATLVLFVLRRLYGSLLAILGS